MLLNMARGESYENYLSRQVKMRPEQQTTNPETPHVHILGLVLFYPKPYFRVVKHAKRCHHVKLCIFLPHLQIKFVKFGATVI